jgi:type I restriction enzyme M protein
MARRHGHRPGDWDSIALRLEEIAAAAGGDALEALFQVLVARLVEELDADGGTFAARLARAQARWPAVVEDAEPRLDPATAARCDAVLEGASLLDSGLMGLDALFEFVASRAGKGSKGQFFTPRHVVHEAVRMLDLKPGESLCDPACGSGAFLVHALLEQPAAQVFGADLDPRAARNARVMLAALGHDPLRVRVADSLDPAEDDGRRFDAVATNPPFAGDVGGRYAGAYELGGPRVERDVLFLERCVRLLRPGGRLAIVLPHNKLGVRRWAPVRRWLLRHVEPWAVVGLGRETFLPHTSQKACLFVGRRRPHPIDAPDPAERVLFVVSERSGKDSAGRLRLRDGASAGPIWDRVDHDLAEATARLRGR